MAWLTTEKIKGYLKIIDTTYDADINKYNPVVQQRVESFINRRESEDYDLPLGYEPDYSKLVFLTLSEATTQKGSGNVKSRSFDGESVTYGDVRVTDIASTSKEQLLKFKPLRKRYY